MISLDRSIKQNKIQYAMNDCKNVDNGIIPDGAIDFIYMRTNIINGKSYIGQRKFYGNWKQYLGSGSLIRRSVAKYGEENFIRRCIDVGYTSDELDIKEQFWIHIYNAVASDCFYNLVDGGRIEQWDELDKLVSYDKIKKRRKELYPTGDDAHTSPVICITTGVIYPSIKIAELETGAKCVSACCRGLRYYAGKLDDGTPLRWAYYDKENNKYIPPKPIEESYNPKAVVQYDLLGNVVNQFVSGKVAASKTNVKYQVIIAVCTGSKLTGGGYVWRYADDPFDKYEFKIKGKIENRVRGITHAGDGTWIARVGSGKKSVHLCKTNDYDKAATARLVAERIYYPPNYWQTEYWEQYDILNIAPEELLGEDKVRKITEWRMSDAS